MVFGLSLLHFGAPGFSGKASVFHRLEWKVSRVNTTSTQGTLVLKAYVHKGVKEGENFTGNFKDRCEHSHIQH